MNTGLMWFRRDLRIHDNAALYHALKAHARVFACFCFDTEILDKLEDRADRRVMFIHQGVGELTEAMKRTSGALIVRHGKATEEIPKLAAELGVSAVYANHDYEPDRLARDATVAAKLAAEGRTLRTFKDHVIFEKDEVLSGAGKPLKVYTPYRNAWRKKLTDFYIKPYPCGTYMARLAAPPARVKSHEWTLKALGFKPTELLFPGGMKAGSAAFDAFQTRIDDYPKTRDFPAVRGTSELSVHLRFGTVSIRELVSEAMAHGSAGAEKWVDELIWREFHNMVLYHWPHITTQSFQPAYEKLKWRQSRADFSAWCDGRTGIPIVDAAMRQLNTTGFMHNRLRMIAASFLTKDLRIDWRWGERYFAEKLLDYDMSQNVGNWQWSASTGTDAQPYFRVFNPAAQSERFDPEGEFIRRYVPELAKYPARLIHEPHRATLDQQRTCGCIIGKDYPTPKVDHSAARLEAIALFKQARAPRTKQKKQIKPDR